MAPTIIDPSGNHRNDEDGDTGSFLPSDPIVPVESNHVSHTQMSRKGTGATLGLDEDQNDSKQLQRSLWNPNIEKAACGVGFIVNIYGRASNKVSQILEAWRSFLNHWRIVFFFVLSSFKIKIERSRNETEIYEYLRFKSFIFPIKSTFLTQKH